MSLVSTLITRNAERWRSMKVDPARISQFDKGAAKLVLPVNKARFVAVENRLQKAGYFCPWWFIGVVAVREYGGPPLWNKQLGQGDPLDQVSRHEPAGRGPFRYHDDASMIDAWERGCLDALIDCAPHAAKWPDWSPGGTMTIWEEYNGLGYAMHGVPSAYVWSGTDQYVSGKYIADHDYRAGVKDVQDGCAPILSRMMLKDPTIHFGKEAIADDKAPPLTPAEQVEADKVLADKGLVAYLVWKLVKHG